jgi:transposase InsO family protein
MPVLWAVLEVRRSGFYPDLHRQPTRVIDVTERAWVARVKAMADDTRGSDGRRRMAQPLQAEGFAVGRAQARRLMHQAGVAVPRPKRRGPVTTDSRHGYAVAPHLLARQCDVAKPAQGWGGDLSYGWTAAGWLSVSTLLDLYARQVVGWAMRRRCETPLVQATLQRARGRRHPSAGLLHHADRGSQYASDAYQDLLADHGMVCSMSGRGECLDNAGAERCFGS